MSESRPKLLHMLVISPIFRDQKNFFIYVCVCVHMYPWRPERVSDLLKLELQPVVKLVVNLL